MKTVLIAGGAGFIGSHLCEALVKRGMKVICADNLKTGKRKNLQNLNKIKEFRFIKADIKKPLRIKEKINYIFNLASYASPPYYQKYSIDTLMTNSLGAYNLLELAKNKKARYLTASTSEVYGDPKVHPQREDYWGNVNPIGVRSCYDEAKRFSESLVMEYVRKHSLDARIIRIFNTYGPRLQKNDGRVISNFIYQATKGKPVTIYGNGKQTRSFCYVSDMVAGLMAAMFRPSLKGQVINIGNPGEFTIKQAADMIRKMTGTKSKIVYKKLPKDDPEKRKPDISKAKRLLSWKPEVSLNKGLALTIEWFKNEK